MLKKILLALAVIFSMTASAQSLKIGLVNVDEVMASMPEVAAAQKQLQETQAKYDTQYKSLGEELQKQVEEYQAMVDKKELKAIMDTKARSIQDNQQKMQQFEQQAMQELQKLQNDLMAPVLQKIQDAVQSVGKEGNFSIIESYEPQLVLYYGSPVENITPLVKAKLGLK